LISVSKTGYANMRKNMAEKELNREVCMVI